MIHLGDEAMQSKHDNAISPSASFLFIGELAKETGTDPKTIRFYERAELISPPRHGRFRTYLASDVQRLKNVLTLRRIGLPIAQIRQLLGMISEGADVMTAPAAATTLRHHLSTLSERQNEIAEQIAQTRRAIDRLAG